MSSQQSRLTDMADINTKLPAIFLWRALSRHKLFTWYTLSYGREVRSPLYSSRSPGTSSSTIKRMPFPRAAGFDDSIGWTSVATS